jgi:AcrR family transcriptional regulator
MASRERALLETTRSLFLQHGFDKVSVEAIARNAHVSPKTIYTRYGGKEGLFIAAMKPKAEAVAANLDIDATDLDAAHRALSLFAEDLLAITLSPGALRMQRVLMGGAARFPKLARKYYANGPGRELAALTNFFERCHRNRFLACPEPALTATFFLGALQGELLRNGLLFDECPTPRERRSRAKAAASMILGALAR